MAADRNALLYADADALFVCTPNRVAPEVVVAALDAGKHVFCEKPPGRTLEGIEATIKAEARNPVLAMKTGLNHRYHLGIMKAIVDSQRYGPVLWAQRQSGDSDWRNDPDAAGGGILLDQGIHMLDLLRYFLGDFVELKRIRLSKNRLRSRGHGSFTQWRRKRRARVGAAVELPNPPRGLLAHSSVLMRDARFDRRR